MKTSHTFTILFWINKSRIIDGRAELFARVTIDGKRTNLGLKRKIEIKRWDSKAKKAIGNSATAREINLHIETVRSTVEQYQFLYKITIK